MHQSNTKIPRLKFKVKHLGIPERNLYSATLRASGTFSRSRS